MSLKPLYDRVVLKRVEHDEKSAGGIFLPGQTEKPQRAVVVSVGTGRVKDDGSIVALTVKEGDQVLFGKYSGNEIELNGEELLIMREDDILAIVEA